MPQGVPSRYWKETKNRNTFMRLCKSARKTAVDWSKFRELDEDGKFKKFSNVKLSQQFRKIRFQRLGICWMCGDEPAIKKFGICESCRDKIRKSQGYKGDQPKCSKKKKLKPTGKKE